MPLPHDLKHYRAPPEEDEGDALDILTWAIIGVAILIGGILMLHVGGPL